MREIASMSPQRSVQRVRDSSEPLGCGEIECLALGHFVTCWFGTWHLPVMDTIYNQLEMSCKTDIIRF